jgi:hypothetical protein
VTSTQILNKSVFIALGSLVYGIPAQKHIWVCLDNRWVNRAIIWWAVMALQIRSVGSSEIWIGVGIAKKSCAGRHRVIWFEYVVEGHLEEIIEDDSDS